MSLYKRQGYSNMPDVIFPPDWLYNLFSGAASRNNSQPDAG